MYSTCIQCTFNDGSNGLHEQEGILLLSSVEVTQWEGGGRHTVRGTSTICGGKEVWLTITRMHVYRRNKNLCLYTHVLTAGTCTCTCMYTNNVILQYFLNTQRGQANCNHFTYNFV